jgi:hypothetical protein
MHMIQTRPAEPYAALLLELRDLVAPAARAVPSGARGRIFAALDMLRARAAPRDHIGLAENVAIATHRLEHALRAGDAVTEAALREELHEILDHWLETAVPATLQ